MGHSYTIAASDTLQAVIDLIGHDMGNGMPGGGFFEVGKEHRDGSITGGVFTANPCRRRGTFRIDPDGSVRRFPGLPVVLRTAAEYEGKLHYRLSNYGWSDNWVGGAQEILRHIATAPGPLSPRIWKMFTEFVGCWQRQFRIMFQVYPVNDVESIAQFIRETMEVVDAV